LPLTYRLDNHPAYTFQKRMASSQKDMDPQGRESAVPLPARRRSGTLGLRKTALESRMHVPTVGLNVEKTISALGQGEVFLLTFPFIGSLRTSCCIIGSGLSAAFRLVPVRRSLRGGKRDRPMRGCRLPHHAAESETGTEGATTYRPQLMFRANRIHHMILAKDR